MGVDLHELHEGTTCSARHFRTLPVTPVVGPRLALANGLLLLATSRSCADFRLCLEGGSLPKGTYHPLAVRPANGYPSLALLPNDPARQRMLRMVLCSPINTVPRGCPPNCPKLAQNGGGEKRAQTVPTGRVIKYPKKCALFCPPGGSPPGEAQKCTQNGPILGVKR